MQIKKEGSHAENVIAPLRQNLLLRYMKKNRAKVKEYLQTKKEDLLMKMKYEIQLLPETNFSESILKQNFHYLNLIQLYIYVTSKRTHPIAWSVSHSEV